jgi:hypothetical protein
MACLVVSHSPPAAVAAAAGKGVHRTRARRRVSGVDGDEKRGDSWSPTQLLRLGAVEKEKGSRHSAGRRRDAGSRVSAGADGEGAVVDDGGGRGGPWSTMGAAPTASASPSMANRAAPAAAAARPRNRHPLPGGGEEARGVTSRGVTRDDVV